MDNRAQVLNRPWVAIVARRVEAGNLGVDVGVPCRASDQGPPLLALTRRYRGFGQMVDDDGELRVALANGRDVFEVAGQHRNEVERDMRRLQRTKACTHIVAEDPIRVGASMYEVPDTD